jgi:twitching motility two-component system response regulator PilH
MANILIIDDSPTYLEALRGMLHKHGHHCTMEQSGEAGIDTALKLKPDLIIMDVIMPKMSGFQATRQLAKNPQTAHIPIVIISTKGQESDKQWGLRQGAKDYLVKEVTEDELISCVNKVLLK